MHSQDEQPQLDFWRVFESAPAPFLIVDRGLTVVEVNDAFLAASGVERRAMIGRNVFDACPPNTSDTFGDGRENFKESLTAVLATGRPDAMALQRHDIKAADGHYEERYWSSVNSPVIDRDGRLTHIIVRPEDVTELVQLGQAVEEHERVAAELRVRNERIEADLYVRARQLESANQQLRKANDELTAAGRVLLEQQQAKDRFIATLSHELRNPLATIRAAIEVIGFDVAEDHPALVVVDRQVDVLVRITEDLLDASRVAAGRLEIESHPLDLRTLVTSAVQDAKADPASETRTVRVSLPQQEVPVDGDAVRLGQMLGNLVSNALSYTLAGGNIGVQLSRSGGQAVLVVRDDGVGFDPAGAEEMFRVFARANPPGSGVGGLGLGLAIVRGIVELHGGSVSAHSDGVGAGAEFRVVLPLTTDPTAAEPAPSTGGASARKPLRVLVIEDNRDLAVAYKALLDHRGDHVTVTYGGRAAIAAALAQPFDLVLCDLGLADIDGYEVARQLRAEPATKGLRLVAVSGFSQAADRERSLRAGFDAHLAKPMALRDLDELLANWPVERA